MRLVTTDKKFSKETEIKIDEQESVQKILRILNDVKSLFTLAKYLIALNQRPEIVSSYVFTGCSKFEIAKKILASSNGLKKNKKFLWRFEEIEKDISYLERIVLK